MNNTPRLIHHREGCLQAECVTWYRNIWYQKPQNLWATFNEGRDVNTKQSLGLTPYVSDLLFFTHDRGLVAIEMKFPGETHEVRRIVGQAKWMIEVASSGYFCDSLEMFQEIIRGGTGIEPESVLEYCLRLGSQKSMTWDSSKFAKPQ